MNEQLPAGDPQRIFERLSKKSLAKIKATKAGAVAQLLTGLSQYWESVAVNMPALKQHDPSELVSLFERYAECQFDSYAEELLPDFSDVDLYLWRLAADVIDRISNEICPGAGFMPHRNRFSGDWTELVRLLKDSKPEVREELRKVLSDPSGEWEIYTGRSFERHLIKHRVRGQKWDDPEANNTVQLLRLVFQMKYQFHLRLFVNRYDFDMRLRAHLSNRLAYWEAQAYHRAISHADELEVPILPQMSKSEPERRALVDGFIASLLEAGRKITRKDIWTVAGYKDATEFERFQRGDDRTTKSAITAFTRVLNMKPADFILVLDKKTGK
jgi:hypothetical protein